jgi:thioesterase-3
VEHVTRIKVRGYHLDGYGHVNNARYLEFLEEARWALVEERAALADLVAQGMGFMIVRVDISFRRPAGFGEVIEVRTAPRRMGRRSATLAQNIVRASDGEIIAQADVTFVTFDLESGRPLEIDERLREAFGPAAGG